MQGVGHIDAVPPPIIMIATFGFCEFACVSNSPNTAQVAFFDRDRSPGNGKWLAEDGNVRSSSGINDAAPLVFDVTGKPSTYS